MQGTGLNLGGLSQGFQLGSQGGQLGQQTANIGGGLGAGGGLQPGGLQFGQLNQAGGGLQLGGGLKLNTPASAAGGLKLGGVLPQQTTSVGGLQLGQPFQGGLQSAVPGGGGLKVGTPKPPPSYSAATQPTQLSGGLQLGGMNKPGGGLQLGAQSTQAGGLQLGTQSTQAGGLQLGAQSTQAGGLQLGTQRTQAGGLQLGGLSTQAGGLQLGGLSTQAGGLQLGAQRTQAGGLQLGGLSTQAGGLQLGGLSTQTTKSGSVQLGNPVSSMGAPTLTGLATSQAKPGSLGTPSTGGGGLKVGPAPKTTAIGGLPGYTAATAPPPQSKKYTYKELEGLVNKWTLELQAQEKLFLQQAVQVNKWDTVLAENGDKIVELNTEVDRVKSEQQRVDNELEMIQSQQQELDDLLCSLEQQVNHTPSHGGLHADMVRTRTFQMAESVDSQLKQMSSDLKRIIEQMNESNTSTDEDNPFTQIVRILNAHTDSLGWIDHEAALLRKKVDDVAKVTAKHREEQELSFRKLAYK